MSLLVAISTVSDGTMLIPDDRSNEQVAINRGEFLRKQSITMQQSTRVNITYDRDDFCQYKTLQDNEQGLGMFEDDMEPADALITTTPNHALFLPLADCVGTVLFDPIQRVLMLSHLGRHSVEQDGGRKSVEYLIYNHKCTAAGIQVWLTPAPGKQSYPMWAFDNRSIKSVVIEQLTSAGIQPHNINNNSSDTTTDERYFSHSQFLAGKQTIDGRHAIVTMFD